MEEFLKRVGINTEEAQVDEDGVLTIDLENFDNFTYAYSQLDNTEELEIDDDTTNFTDTNGTVLFVGSDYHISIVSDFDNDIYKLVCEENY